jgi:hypothetical protein
MKRAFLSLLVFSVVGLVAIAPVCAQTAIPLTIPAHPYYTYGTLQGRTNDEAVSASMAATTIPMAAYTIKSTRDGNTYPGVLVGRSPFFHGNRTTNVPTFIVPVKVKMPDGGVFDPAVADSKCLGGKVPTTVAQNSPIFQSAPFTMNGENEGTTQYIDAFQRAEFSQLVSASGHYHVMLNPVMTLPEQTFTVPANEGGTFTNGGCENLGVMDVNTWDSFVRSTLIPFVTAQGGGTTSFPFFLLYNVGMSNFSGGVPQFCCILGYHNAFTPGGNIQTYGVGDFDSQGNFIGTGDISAISHEVGEWMNDPTGGNATPAWGGIGQVGGCQGNFEVGDPLSGTLFTPAVTMNGFTYHPQELAFFSWFYASPSLGSGGKFSNNGKFGGDAKTCPPGGTN